MSPQPLVFSSQLELPVAASSPQEAVRKQEFDLHVNDDSCHLPTGGLIGQVLVMTALGLAWKFPKIVCGCGTGKITFVETTSSAQQQGVNFNVVREVDII